MPKIKIMLVDDHDLVMDGIASLFNEMPEFQIVGKASSVSLARTMIQQVDPHLVLTDISMGETSGIDIIRHCNEHFPTIKFIVLTMHDSVQHISAMLQAGALGYLLKNVKQDELFTAVQSVMAGRQYIQKSLAGNYVRALNRQATAEKQSPLSPREIEIVRLIAQDFSTAGISKQLFLSEHTVETHRKNIGRKIGAKTIAGLISYAREHHLL